MMYPFRPRRKIQSVQTVRTAICMYPFEQSIQGRTAAASVKGTACASCCTESKSNIVWRANGKRHDNVARRGPSVRPAAPADSGCSTESAIPGKIAGRGRALASPIEGPTAKPTSECKREGSAYYALKRKVGQDRAALSLQATAYPVSNTSFFRYAFALAFIL